MGDYDSVEKIRALSTIDPEFAQLVESNAFPAPRSASLEEKRAALHQREHDTYAQTKDDSIEEHTVKIPMRDGYENEALVFKSVNSHGSKRPLVVLIYGGGFTHGSNKQFAPWSRIVASLHGAVVANISYRLAPENVFPTAPNDAWDNIEWLAANAATLGADLKEGFVVGGASAGGNLAAVTTHKAVKENLQPPITGLLACIPSLLHEDILPEKYRDVFLSRTQNAVVPGPFLDKAAIDQLATMYSPDRRSPDWSPFNMPETFASMPPVCVQVAGLDPLRDDGLIYERELRANGVPTRLDVSPGLPHGHMQIPGLSHAVKFREIFAASIGWLLNGGQNS